MNMTVLIDSWAWIEYWKGGKDAGRAAEHIEGTEKVVISVVNVAEVYFWVLKHYGGDVAGQKSKSMLRRSYVIVPDTEIAISAAKLKAEHRLGLADSFVLATARSANAKVVTGDPDLKSFLDVVFIGS
jgi:predicted nucleic acid-binding protein